MEHCMSACCTLSFSPKLYLLLFHYKISQSFWGSFLVLLGYRLHYTTKTRFWMNMINLEYRKNLFAVLHFHAKPWSCVLSFTKPCFRKSGMLTLTCQKDSPQQYGRSQCKKNLCCPSLCSTPQKNHQRCQCWQSNSPLKLKQSHFTVLLSSVC